ncbi:putative Neuroligin-3 [Operophtera brumata]|uniref:Putative Neuroligin-3 n=1 Tax=Operophtera brumata TaxID=104452 RepID=A0A0L7KUI4_OPEBR|nr:putative Neuroligin-3 [Operophtera brumata]
MRQFSESDSKLGVKSDSLGVKSDSKLIHSTQNDSPSEDNYEDHDTDDYTKVNFEKPYYNSEDFLHLNSKFYSGENDYSNYEVYKKFYLNPSDPLPKSSVKFKISSRIVQTKYGKLQGIVLAMDEHRYLSPLEVFRMRRHLLDPIVSDRPGPACPQKLPDLDDERTILEKMPKGRLEYMKRLMPYLKNQSEDCFHPYDGAVLASYTDLIVVTLNFRLGVLAASVTFKVIEFGGDFKLKFSYIDGKYGELRFMFALKLIWAK